MSCPEPFALSLPISASRSPVPAAVPLRSLLLWDISLTASGDACPSCLEACSGSLSVGHFLLCGHVQHWEGRAGCPPPLGLFWVWHWTLGPEGTRQTFVKWNCFMSPAAPGRGQGTGVLWSRGPGFSSSASAVAVRLRGPSRCSRLFCEWSMGSPWNTLSLLPALGVPAQPVGLGTWGWPRAACLTPRAL